MSWLSLICVSFSFFTWFWLSRTAETSSHWSSIKKSTWCYTNTYWLMNSSAFILMLFHATAKYFNLRFTTQITDMCHLCLFKRTYIPLGHCSRMWGPLGMGCAKRYTDTIKNASLFWVLISYLHGGIALWWTLSEAKVCVSACHICAGCSLSTIKYIFWIL
jgi:hypothetical protein